MSNDKLAPTFHPGVCPTCGDRTIGTCCDEAGDIEDDQRTDALFVAR